MVWGLWLMGNKFTGSVNSTLSHFSAIRTITLAARLQLSFFELKRLSIQTHPKSAGLDIFIEHWICIIDPCNQLRFQERKLQLRHDGRMKRIRDASLFHSRLPKLSLCLALTLLTNSSSDETFQCRTVDSYALWEIVWDFQSVTRIIMTIRVYDLGTPKSMNLRG